MAKLCGAVLPDLAAKGLQVPDYDRAATSVGIVHIGVGGFHRSHQAVFTDDVLRDDPSWGICGVNLLPFDARMRDVMAAQERLYTVWARGSAASSVRVVGAHAEYIFAPDDQPAVVARLAQPTTRVITLTLTEKGYCLDIATGRLDSSLPSIQADAAALRAGEETSLVTAPGFLLASFQRRRQAGLGGVAVLSCDNLQENGHRARAAVVGLAELVGEDLAGWVRENVAFPNSMVDRITPATLPGVAEELRDRYGVDDMWPVICEDFALWVIEDNFPCGRPAWERATTGKCLFVEDVLPYELMKLRLLNGAHQAIAYTGLLLGHRKVHDAMSDEAALAYLTAYMDAVAKTCPTVPGISLEEWQVGTRARFANAAVEDQLLRLAEDARNRIQVAVVPCLIEASALRPVAMLIACWLRCIASSRDELGAALEAAPDPAREGLEPLALEALNSADEATAARFLAEAFGTESLGPALAGEVARSLGRIGSVGLRAALAEF